MENIIIDHKISLLPQEIILIIYKFTGLNLIEDHLKESKSKCCENCSLHSKLLNLSTDISLKTEIKITTLDAKDFFTLSNKFLQGNLGFITNLSLTGLKFLKDYDLDIVTKKCRNVKKINISNNPLITNKGIKIILKNLLRLKELNCSGFFVPKPKFDNEIFEYCLNHENLKIMNLFWCKESISGDKVLEFVKNSNTIRKINIRHCSKLDKLWEIATKQLKHTPPMESLINISIQNNQGNLAEIFF